MSQLFGRVIFNDFIQTFDELGHGYFASFLLQICSSKKLFSHLLLFVTNFISRGKKSIQIFSALSISFTLQLIQINAKKWRVKLRSWQRIPSFSQFLFHFPTAAPKGITVRPANVSSEIIIYVFSFCALIS